MRKYQLPKFLEGTVSQANYEKWLSGRSMAHFRRDKKRGNSKITNENYKKSIHKAVEECDGYDAYTYEQLDWTLISKYDNKESKKGGREYKSKFALLPSVDHVGDGTGSADFKICAWRTNDSKSDLSYDEFIILCRKVIAAVSKRLQ